MDSLALDEAYRSMFYYLDDYYTLTRSDEIGGLLSGFAVLQDGGSGDPAAREDWSKAVARAQRDTQPTRNCSNTKPSLGLAYRSTVYFLEDLYELTEYPEVGEILGPMSILQDGSPADPAVRKNWKKAVDRAKWDTESVMCRFVSWD